MQYYSTTESIPIRTVSVPITIIHDLLLPFVECATGFDLCALYLAKFRTLHYNSTVGAAEPDYVCTVYDSFLNIIMIPHRSCPDQEHFALIKAVSTPLIPG